MIWFGTTPKEYSNRFPSCQEDQAADQDKSTFLRARWLKNSLDELRWGLEALGQHQTLASHIRAIQFPLRQRRCWRTSWEETRTSCLWRKAVPPNSYSLSLVIIYAVIRPWTSHHDNGVLLTAVKSASLTSCHIVISTMAFREQVLTPCWFLQGTLNSPQSSPFTLVCPQRFWECPPLTSAALKSHLFRGSTQMVKIQQRPCVRLFSIGWQSTQENQCTGKKFHLACIFGDISSWSAESIPLDITHRRKMVVEACGKGCCSPPGNWDRC